jgi:RHS repeat-associated protein
MTFKLKVDHRLDLFHKIGSRNSGIIPRLLAVALTLLMVMTTTPLAALAMPEIPHHPDAPSPPPANVQVKTGPRSVTIVKPELKFSAAPTDLELTTARVFQEPLVPMSNSAVPGENVALASAIKTFKNASSSSADKGSKADTSGKEKLDLAPFEKFIAEYPSSRWVPSVQVNLAEIKFKSGYLSEALALFLAAWEGSKTETDRDKAAVANQAISSLLIIDARVGRKDELKKYLAVVKKRAFFGSAEQKILGAKEGLWSMETAPERSFKCGPYALNSILNISKTSHEMNPILEKAQSTDKGTNLAQVKDWSDQVGLKYRAAKRSKGASFPVPSLFHWSVDHFAAIVGLDNGLYHIKDPTFDTDGQLWVTAKALEQETDGYFLVPSNKPLPPGWSPVSDEEAKTVFGKGTASGRNQNDTTPDAPENDPPCGGGGGGTGMASANAYSMLASLHIKDTPMGYSPPIGPEINYRFDYAHLQTNQPGTFSFTNLGQNWNFNWLSYLTVDPSTSVASVRVRQGGTEVYALSGGVYTPNFLSQALLVNMGGGVYERRMKDGSVEVYNQPDSSSPARIFLTQVKDPQGNTVFVQYDVNFRISTITDAIGQVSTINYLSNTVGNVGFYKISSIVDPFARSISFAYDSTTSNLLSITDVVALKSSFQYDTTSSFISQLTTPYGTTSFYNYVPGIDVYPAVGLRFTYPDGTSSVIENWIDERKSTYYWDRHALAMYPNDPVNHIYTHCELMKWTFDTNTGLEASSTQWVTHPLESTSPIYMRYPGSIGLNYAGPTNLPSSVSRNLGNLTVNLTVGGTVTPGDIVGVRNDYNYALYTVQAGDTLAKVATGIQNSVNTNAIFQTNGVTAGAIGNTVSLRSERDLSRTYTTYASVGATETLTLLSQVRQSAIATLTGAIAVGDRFELIAEYPTRITVFYNAQAGDTATVICTNLAALLNANTTWQNYGGVATANSNNIDLVCYSPEEQLYTPGTTGFAYFYAHSYRSGTSQLTENLYNSSGHLTQSIDPMRRTFSYTYAANGVDLLEKRETQGTDNYLLGHWEYNTKHQPIVYIDGSAQRTEITYNSSGQVLTVKDPNNNITTNTYTGTSKATVGGTVTAGNVLTITVFDSGLAGGQKAVNYTVLAGATLTTIATGIRNAINADSALAAIGVTATSSAAVVTLLSTSVNVTSYTSSVSGGATETLTLGANTWGYLTKIDGPLSGNKDITTFTYDTFGRVASQTSSTGYVLTFLYDAMNRRLRTTYPDTTYEQSIYNRLDVVLSRDRNGRWTQRAFDSLDQMSYEVDPLGRKTQYTWCSCGSVAVLTDPLGRQTSWSHDIQGRLTTKTYPDSSTYTYVYEERTSNIKQRTDALAQKTIYLYNPDGSLFITMYPNAINATANVAKYWDYNFKRQTKAAKNDWGSIDYSYNNYVTSSGATPITGGGRLQLVHNDRMANSDISFVFDSLGRITNQSVNGVANSDTLTFDAMSRVTAESNALGNFTYAYVDDTPGSSKGSTRLASVTYPNSQVTKYSWYPNTGDERLQQIANLKTTSGPTISQFGYRYNPAGEITQWQQLQGNSSVNLNLGYDQAGQLTSSQTGSGGPSNAYLNQNYFAYDAASNRTAVQQNSVNRVKLGGTVTTGNTLTITVKDLSLAGGQEAVIYTVVGGDTLSTIATKFAAAITANANLQTLGVNASANGAAMSIKSASPNITTYTQSNGGGTETISLGVTNNFVENAVIGGTKTTGNILTITVLDSALSGGLTAVNYTVLAGDTLTTMATGLKNAINANAGLTAAGITATSVGTAITIKSTSANATTYSQSTSIGATATIALSVNQNGPQTIAIGGSKTTGDTITITVYDAGLAGGLKAVTYTVLAGDTLTSIATGLAAALTADANLQGAGISATSASQVVTLQSNSINQTTLRETTSATATEQIALNVPANGVQTASIGGTKTTGDTLTVTTFDAGLPGGSQAIIYTVLAGDTLSSIATGLATAINANANLAAVGVTASASSTVLNVKSTSINNTTYTKSLSGGATETITLAPATSASQYSYNNLNELIAIAAGGATKFEATTNKALKSATVNSNPATLNWSKNFTGNASMSNGTNTVPVGATDGANNTVINNYQVAVNGPSSTSLTFDANGNMTSDGVKTFAWDAENRLIKITYPGGGNFSQLLYDANGIKGQITETVASALTSTKQLVNSGSRICEERDASNAVTKKFFGRGQTMSGSNYFYFFDHLGSIRDLIDSSGIVQAHYEYDLFGQRTRTTGALDSDFQYAGYYMHAQSGLNLTVYRAYNSSQGRWINRDPIQEDGDLDLYAYSRNSPLTNVDPSGLQNVLSAGTHGKTDFMMDKFEALTGAAPGTFNFGCISVVDYYLNLGSGVVPESVYGKNCFWGAGSNTKPAVEKAVRCTPPCPKGTRKVIWCKQGTWGSGGLNPNAPGSPVSNPGDGWNNGGNSNFNYAVYFPETSTYSGANVGGGAGYTSHNMEYGSEFGSSMCCATCVKK